jgi:hypothetical protein
MPVIQKDERRIELERLHRNMRSVQALESRATHPLALKRARLRTVGAALRVKVFMSARPNGANRDLSKAAPRAALEPVAQAIAADDWNGAALGMKALTEALSAFASAADLPYDDGEASLLVVVAELDGAIAVEDAETAWAAIEAIAVVIDADLELARMKAQKASMGGHAGARTVRVRGQDVRLSAREVAICTEVGASIQVYAENKLVQLHARRGVGATGRAERERPSVHASHRVAAGRFVTLAIAMPGGEPPREFRIFAAGKNTTAKGEYLFDELAARDVMAAYTEHGADVMIDLEHLSVSDPDRSVNFDPDARGWCKLSLRSGELWAINVKWTADGAARLRQKRQRYISPAFACDPETSRITELLNIAITAAPATHNLMPLVAASR